MTVFSAFPRRPVRVHVTQHFAANTKLKAWIWLLIGVGVTGMALFVTGPQIVEELSVGQSGVQASSVQVEHSRCTVSTTWEYSCTFDFRYPVAGGAEQSRRVRYETHFQRPVPENLPLILRYDPRDPKRISTSWGQAHLMNRALGTVFLFVCGVWIAVSRIQRLRWMTRSKRLVESVGLNPVPVVATVQGLQAGGWTYSFPTAGPRSQCSGRTEMHKKNQPFWLNQARTQALALASETGESILLTGTLDNVELTEQERAALFAARDAALQCAAKGEDIRFEVRLTPQEAAVGKSVVLPVPVEVNGKREITVHVPAGLVDGTRLRMAGIGWPGVNGGQPGDVFVVLQIA